MRKSTDGKRRVFRLNVLNISIEILIKRAPLKEHTSVNGANVGAQVGSFVARIAES